MDIWFTHLFIRIKYVFIRSTRVVQIIFLEAITMNLQVFSVGYRNVTEANQREIYNSVERFWPDERRGTVSCHRAEQLQIYRWRVIKKNVTVRRY